VRDTGRIVLVVVYRTVGMELAEQKMMILRHRFQEFLSSLRQNEKLGAVQGLQGSGGMGRSAPKWVRAFSQSFIMRDK
jgi:hypothetical protein